MINAAFSFFRQCLVHLKGCVWSSLKMTFGWSNSCRMSSVSDQYTSIKGLPAEPLLDKSWTGSFWKCLSVTFPFISSLGSFQHSFARFIRPFSVVLRLGFISCLPHLWWWSQICGLGQTLTSFPSFLSPWLFPSSSSFLFAFCLTHLASLLLGGACRSARNVKQKMRRQVCSSFPEAQDKLLVCSTLFSLFVPISWNTDHWMCSQSWW